jgi:integrase
VRETFAGLYRQMYGQELPRTTASAFVHGWLTQKRPETSRATMQSYEKTVRAFLAFLDERADADLSEVTKADLVKFRNVLSERLAAKTVNRYVKTLRMLFKAARRDGVIFDDPSEFVERVKERSKDVRRPFTLEELRAIMGVADDEWRSMLRFGLFTGQRLYDVAALRWEQINLAREEIRLRAKKTGKGLTLPLAGPLLRHVRALAAAADPEGPVHPRAFASVQRNEGSVSTLSNQFGDLLARAGLRAEVSHDANKQGRGARRTVSDLSFHSLRHSAVSMLKTAGIAESVVMELVGHDSVEVSRHYTHTGRDALKAAAEALPEL